MKICEEWEGNGNNLVCEHYSFSGCINSLLFIKFMQTQIPYFENASGD